MFISQPDKRSKRAVDPNRLMQLILNAQRIEVKDSPRPNSNILFESSQRKDIEDLSRALVVVVPPQEHHCMCLGTPAIYLYNRNNKLFLTITNHHGQNVRCSIWDSDAPIVNQEAFLHWFDARGMAGPRSEVHAARARTEKSYQDKERWRQAMPPGLERVWEETSNAFGNRNAAALYHVLVENVPERKHQVLSLLQWFGSGAGPWSGFPAYETAPENMLIHFYSVPEILLVLQEFPLTAEQVEGAARLLGGYTFRKHYEAHPEDLVPRDIQSKLLDFVIQTSPNDTDKLKRAQTAFGGVHAREDEDIEMMDAHDDYSDL